MGTSVTEDFELKIGGPCFWLWMISKVKGRFCVWRFGTVGLCHTYLLWDCDFARKRKEERIERIRKEVCLLFVIHVQQYDLTELK